ncbi:MAG: hypothetical protein J5848_02740 [Bacteroidales bacterium]|nr:hypothetical protein [Bacteroidales bacterium]
MSEEITKTNQQKNRHGFVTFWLWLGIIANAITVIRSLLQFGSTNIVQQIQSLPFSIDLSPYQTIQTCLRLMLVIGILACIGIIIGNGMILNWKKKGFWLNCIVAAICLVSTLILWFIMKGKFSEIGSSPDNSQIITQAIITPISLVIMWAILQIKKDDISCWKQLE